MVSIQLVDTDLRMSTSETTTSMSDTDSGSGGDDDHAPAVIDLTYERLQSLHSHGTIPKKELSDYAKRGVSSSRIKGAVNKPCCTCMCRLPVKLLYKICLAFWTLTKSSQDALLWSIQHESGNQQKKRWYMAGPLTHGQWDVQTFTFHPMHNHPLKRQMCSGAGYPMCKDAWAHCLGVGKHRLGRCRNTFQGRDGRSLTGPGGYYSDLRSFNRSKLFWFMLIQIDSTNIILIYVDSTIFGFNNFLLLYDDKLLSSNFCGPFLTLSASSQLRTSGACIGEVIQREQFSDPSLLDCSRTDVYRVSLEKHLSWLVVNTCSHSYVFRINQYFQWGCWKIKHRANPKDNIQVQHEQRWWPTSRWANAAVNRLSAHEWFYRDCLQSRPKSTGATRITTRIVE